jgi:WD40 repeat protein
MVLGPDGKTVMTAAADESLRFWKIFDVETKVNTVKKDVTTGSSITRPLSLR